MDNITVLLEKLQHRRPLLLDGATGTELERRGVPMHGKAWSAEAVLSHPQTVQEVHEDYILAGAEIITVNSFSLARHMLGPAGLLGQFQALNTAAVKLAIAAREKVARSPIAIAGSIAPTTFCQDASKGYLPVQQAAAGYREQAQLLCEAGVDLLIVEMISDIEQGCLAVEAAGTTGLPVWLGFSCRRDKNGSLLLWDLNHSISQAVQAMVGLGGSLAFIMHTEVRDATEAFAELQKSWTGLLGVYAHSGVFKMPNWQFNDVITPEQYALEARQWLAMGATVIGGCCGIGPSHIAALRQLLAVAG